MSVYEPSKEHLRHALLLFFNLKKSAAESHRLLEDAYNDRAPSKKTCELWYQRFKNGDFDLSNKDRGRPSKKFEDEELQALLDEDNTQTQRQLAQALNVTPAAICDRLKSMGKIQKEGKWVPHVLTERNMENRKTICEILIQRFNRKSFLHRIVTGDEKWIYFDNAKRKKSWVDPGQPSTFTIKRNIHGMKALLCIWWDQKGVLYYELLKPGQTITAERYREQLMALNRSIKNKRPEWATRHGKVVLLHDNARPHVAKPVKDTLEVLGWDVLPHPPYSPDVAPSDYHLFRSMAHGLSDQHFNSFEEVDKWLKKWIDEKQEQFFFDGIHKLPRIWEKVVANDDNYIQ